MSRQFRKTFVQMFARSPGADRERDGAGEGATVAGGETVTHWIPMTAVKGSPAQE